MSDTKSNFDFCPHCLIGRQREIKAPYVSLYHGMVISAAEMPAYVCDVCGFQEFDRSALKALIDLAYPYTESNDDNSSVTHNVPAVDAPSPTKPPRPNSDGK